jgi:hypothetical protein
LPNGIVAVTNLGAQPLTGLARKPCELWYNQYWASLAGVKWEKSDAADDSYDSMFRGAGVRRDFCTVENVMAYNSRGIIVGTMMVVPEPATLTIGLGALALSATGIRRWRSGVRAKYVRR